MGSARCLSVCHTLLISEPFDLRANYNRLWRTKVCRSQATKVLISLWPTIIDFCEIFAKFSEFRGLSEGTKIIVANFGKFGDVKFKLVHSRLFKFSQIRLSRL